MKDRSRFSPPDATPTDPSGFTVIEMMVAMAVFLLLGSALALFMNSSISAYRTNMARKKAYSSALSVLTILGADLENAFLAPGDRNPDVDVKFVCSREPNGCSKLVFVASSPDPAADPDDRGLREIAWYTDGAAPPFRLLRAERVAVGGEHSLFASLSPDDGGTACDMVGYFALVFFPDAGALTDEGSEVSPDQLRDGVPIWDSTRGILPDFPWKADDSADDPWDDILPERVRVVLTVFPTFGMRAYLMEDAPAEATTLKVDTTEGFPPPGNDLESFVLVDSEWMRIVQVTGDSFTVERGARGTSPAAHSSGAEVRAGYSFMKVVYIPCHGKAVR